MTFSEEVPANFKPRCDCKRRNCPLQLYTKFTSLKPENEKRFFTYQCSDPKTWAVCLRHIEVSEKPAKATMQEQPTQQPKQPASEPKPKTNSEPHNLKEPTKQQHEHRCNQYPYDCHLCAQNQQDKCGIETAYRKPPT